MLRAGLATARALPRAGESGGVFYMGPLDEAPAPDTEPISQPAGRFWLLNSGGGLLGLHKACTHLDCLCDWDDQNRQFVCPCHGSRFAQDGTVLSGPATRSLDRFVVVIAEPNGEVVAETDPGTGAPLPVPGAANALDENMPPGEKETVENSEATGPDYILLVDTGRMIPGESAT
jgi:cytochrome b6-f complex iron-sulfur subunit